MIESISVISIFLIIAIWVSSAFFTVTVATQKDCNGFLWFIGGLIFGPLALNAACGMPDKRSRKYLRRIAERLDE